ncbi:CbiX/SirB N-terminal domain-containing protein [Staphylococcus chromogenes]|nr:CbiX/SirB N-terminal domain-containing protein [Staphylococcus chromogenes]
MTIVLLAHGSRHPDAAAGVERLAAEVEIRTAKRTAVAYLDLQQPTVDKVAQPGDTVVPLLFTDAFHARVDVPTAVAGLDVRLTPGLSGDTLIDALSSLVTQSSVLYAVGSSTGSPEVYDLARALSQRTGHVVEVAFATRGPSVLDAAVRHASLTVIPLFVTSGLLLDKLHNELPRISAASGCQLSVLPPLSARLAPVIADLVT